MAALPFDGLFMVMKLSEMILLAAAMMAMDRAAGASGLAIDPAKSKIEVAVSCSVDSFVGRLEKYQALVECEPAAALPLRATVDFDFADLKTGSKGRDAAMLKWLQYETNRTAAFQLTGWHQSGSTNVADGSLKIHGVTNFVHMPVVVGRTGENWDISGRAVINYRDFKLPHIRKALLLTVDPVLVVNFHLVAGPGAAK